MKEITSLMSKKMMAAFYDPYYNLSKELLGRKYARLRLLRNVVNTEFFSRLSDLFIHQNRLDD